MPEPSAFDYAVLRVVPHVEREEFINVGVILFCRARNFLDARTHLDARRLTALAPDLDVAQVQEQLDLVRRICVGGAEAGPLDELNQVERFRWLTSPRSTSLQVSPVHGGICDDPRAALDDLFARLVC
jgi:Protein of unknown function (DUF3037)